MGEKDVTEYIEEVAEKGELDKGNVNKKGRMFSLFGSKEEADNDRLARIEQDISDLTDRVDMIVQDLIKPDEKDAEIKKVRAEIDAMIDRHDGFARELLSSIAKTSLSEMEKELLKKMIKGFKLQG